MSDTAMATFHAGSQFWATGLWRACWEGALFILVAAVVCRLFPRLTASARCWLWWLACLKLLVSLVWAVPLSLPLLPATWEGSLWTRALPEHPAADPDAGGDRSPH